MFKKWQWKFEITPMYGRVQRKPLTVQKQEFKVLCGLKSPKIFKGDRLPFIGEQVEIPNFSDPPEWKRFVVNGIREYPLLRNSKQSVYRVNINANSIAEEGYWTSGGGIMIPVSEWYWELLSHHDYESYGSEPSDWKNGKLKFKERDFVLSWKYKNSMFVAPNGKKYEYLGSEHDYLIDWFPEVEQHLRHLQKGSEQ